MSTPQLNHPHPINSPLIQIWVPLLPPLQCICLSICLGLSFPFLSTAVPSCVPSVSLTAPPPFSHPFLYSFRYTSVPLSPYSLIAPHLQNASLSPHPCVPSLPATLPFRLHPLCQTPRHRHRLSSQRCFCAPSSYRSCSCPPCL